jgi:hypothetical protein
MKLRKPILIGQPRKKKTIALFALKSSIFKSRKSFVVLMYSIRIALNHSNDFRETKAMTGLALYVVKKTTTTKRSPGVKCGS